MMQLSVREMLHLAERKLYANEPSKSFLIVCDSLACADKALEEGDFISAAHAFACASFASMHAGNRATFARLHAQCINLHDDLETRFMLGGSKPLLRIKLIDVQWPTTAIVNELLIGRAPDPTPFVQEGPAKL